MTGADIFIAGVRPNGSTYVQDFHANGETMPVLDTQQDWRLLDAYEIQAENKTILKFSRLLDTCDEQDLAIGSDTTRIIWALGDSDTIAYHGGTNRGTKSMNLINPQIPELDLASLQNYAIDMSIRLPPMDTVYWCTLHKGPTLTRKHHIVACDTLVYTWAKGGKMMIFPEDVGFPIGETSTAQYYMVEVHYDNPQRLEGIFVETGLIMHYTPKLRSIDAGILAIGQGVDISLTIPPNQDGFKVVGHCSPQCTQEALGPEGITVFGSMLHSHKSGRKMKTRHLRENIELPWIDFDNPYDFSFQQNKVLLQTRQILPGDQLSVECTYSSIWRNGKPVIGGRSSYEEMCQSVLWYYPRNQLQCMSRYDVDTHLADFGVEKYHIVRGLSSLRYIVDTPAPIAGDYYDLVATKFNWTYGFLRAYQEERLNGSNVTMWRETKTYKISEKFNRVFSK
ncbi:DBH-like monooxygenase protein 1 [Folsomia candida]|nr:DBH-like monooxygenase protein 1 [Folsomia candida]